MLQGFHEAVPSDKRRLILSVEGMAGKGKSTLALSAPGPIALFDFDTGLEGILEKFLAEGKEVLVPEQSMKHSDTDDPKEWEEMWKRFAKSYADALVCPDIRTVIVDTATEAWELKRLAAFGQLSQVMPHQYGLPNAVFRRLIKAAYDSDKNLILLHKLKPRYVNDKRTNEYDMSGFSDMPYIVQVVVRVFRHRMNDDGDSDFGMTIRKCRPNAQLEDTKLLEPMSTFPFLAAEVFPDTDLEDWE